MVKRMISLVLVFMLLFTNSIYAKDTSSEKFFLGSSDYVSSLEDLAGRRLYVYNLIDSVSKETIDLEVDATLSIGEAGSLLSRFFGVSNPLLRSSIPYFESGFKLECNVEQFLYLLLNCIEEDFNNSVEKANELGLLEHVSVNREKFTKGDAYLILSNLLDIEREDMTYKEKLVDLNNCREEFQPPEEIRLYVSSFDDFSKKLDAAYFFMPSKIYLEFLDVCTEEDMKLIYSTLLQYEYAWDGEFDNFYDISSTYSWRALGLRPTFDVITSDKLHWRLSKDERAISLLEYEKVIDEQLKQGEISEDYRDYLLDMGLMSFLTKDTTVIVYTPVFNDYMSLNVDILDWMKCYNDERFTKKIIKCLKDMEKYKDLSDYEKVSKVHTYICQNSSYDYSEYRDMQSKSPTYNYRDAHEVIGFVKDGRIVCDGYAYTFQWLLDYLDVESIVVYGDSTLKSKRESHAWNKVKIEDKWYNVDVCWADTGEGMRYFLKSDKYYDTHYHKIDEDYTELMLTAEDNYRS